MFLEFDGWDQELLRNAKPAIKRLFKYTYNSRDFDFKMFSGRRLGQMHVNRLKELFKIPSGDRILPRFRRKRLKSNVLNSDGDLCEKPD
jgi:hypothetical protein